MTNENTVNIRISGADAEAFLQGMLTCDVLKLAATPVLAAACSQKGRIIANFWIWRDGADFYVRLPASMSETLMTHLQKYVLRSKVTFVIPDSIRNPEIVILDPQVKPEDDVVVWILPETSEQFTPQMIGLEKHGGVSFTKGCYLGQEIIARTEHLGKLKRHLYQIKFDSDGVKVADEIQNKKGDKLGVVVAVMDNDVFAVIEDRAVEDVLSVNGIVINIML